MQVAFEEKKGLAIDEDGSFSRHLRNGRLNAAGVKRPSEAVNFREVLMIGSSSTPRWTSRCWICGSALWSRPRSKPSR